METKKGKNVSVIEEKIINASIESLRKEGLKFSVDTLADKLKISKKTVYKHFPDKAALALALYQKYYEDAMMQAERLADNSKSPVYSKLLHLYFDSKMMIRSEVFNKYKLNASVYAYATNQNDLLWEAIFASFATVESEKDGEVLRFIIDGSFEKLCDDRMAPNIVIERLVKLL